MDRKTFVVPMADSLWQRLRSWALESDGSTRPIALVRIGLALIAWARYGAEIRFFQHPEPLRLALDFVFCVSTGLMFVGLWTRLSTLATAGLLGLMNLYGALHPYASSWRAHNSYLLFILTFLCALAPSGRSYSLDRWIAAGSGRRSVLLAERGNLWAQRLIMIQIGLVYFWSAFDKATAGYFNGARVEQILMTAYLGRYPDWREGFHVICIALGSAVVCTEFLLAIGLLFLRRLLPWLIVVGILFHTLLYLGLRVDTFSATMILAYLCFLDPDGVHRWLDRVQITSLQADESNPGAKRDVTIDTGGELTAPN